MVNACGIVLAVGFLIYLCANALYSGYPWSLICYYCKKCNAPCVVGIDPQGFITSSYSNDPNVSMYVTNGRLPLGRAMEVDPSMVVQAEDGRKLSAAVMKGSGVDPGREVLTYRMRAKDAAQLCLSCGACEKACPIGLPISAIVKDLREHGAFRGK